MEPSDENITSLLGMGFEDIGQVRRALRLAKNDLSEAVSILTGEDNREGFIGPENIGDVEMKDTQYRPGDNDIMPSLVAIGQEDKHKQPPPSYNEAVSTTGDDTDSNSENVDIPLDSVPDEFPTTNLYELQERIFTENWSIPYRKNESLGKCLLGATKVTLRGDAEKDANCRKFMERAMPECFQKLLTSDAVRRWNTETLEGVYNMLQLFIDLAAARLQFEPVPIKLLSVLTQAFDPDCEYHFKNRNKRWDRAYYEDLFGFQKCPAVSPQFSIGREPFGWLVNLINRFAYKNGFSAICDRVEQTEHLSAPILAALLQPLGVCAAYLNPEVAGYKLGSAADKAVTYVKDLKDSDIKEKEIGKVFDLLRTLKLLCQMLWKDKLSFLDELHLGTLLNMLKSAHYNARMNSLKEICKLIKESEKVHLNKTGIPHDSLMHWLLDNKVLSIAFQSSLHQHQYCEKLKKVVEFAGAKLSNDELTTIWTMQTGKHNTVVDNIHNIIASAAQSFNAVQLEHLISLLQQSWNSEDEKSRGKLLLLIGRIGREVNDTKAVAKLLEVVWGLAHIDSQPTYLINQAVQSHLDILTQSQYAKDQIKNSYIEKCIQDIKSGRWVVPAIKHLQSNLEAMLKQPYSKSHKSMLQDLQKQTDVIKLVTISLMRSHQQAVECAGSNALDGSTIIANQYAYGETVVTHLRFVAYVLQDGALYLSFTRVKDIWDCLMLDSNNCEGDYETAFEWFTEGITDLEHETQRDLFTSRMLKVDVPKISQKGFKCFRAYFESVNAYEHKIKRTGQNIVVEKQDLTGLSYLWQIVLETPYEDIAEDAAQYLIQLSYTLLSPRLKKTDPVNIHKRYIAECYKRLELSLSHLESSDAEHSDAKQTQKQRKSSAKSLERETVLLGIKRLLVLACYYITTVEDSYVIPRSFPPHGACFHGFPVILNVNHETTKTEFELQSHSNESLSSVRRKIAKHLATSSECVIITLNDKALTNNKDQKLLHQLNFETNQAIGVRTVTCTNGASANAIASVADDEGLKPSSQLEREKGLPSYLMAIEYKVFDKLYELALLEETGVTDALRGLLQLLPTDASVPDAFDVFSQDALPQTPSKKRENSNLTQVFEEYFKLSGTKMSSFRLLYNLQVLSSKLIPTEEKESPSTFRENFLDAGGLSLILNILQPDAIPTTAAYELRQSCYFVCLQLARSLLCGETSQAIILSFGTPVKTAGATANGMTATTPDVSMTSSMATSTPIKFLESPHRNQGMSGASSWPGARSASPVSMNMMSSSPGSSAGATPDNASEPKRPRAGSLIDSIAPSARIVLEMMSRDDYAETIACLMRVAWAAAAGQLQLNTYRHKRNDDIETTNSLKSGICLTKTVISTMDALLSENAIELLVMCLQLRANLMNVFYYLPDVNEFIIDILIGSPSLQVRTSAVTQLSALSAAEITESKVEKTRDFLVRTLLKAPVPLWNPSSYVRGSNYRIHSQCTPYFDLLCHLLRMLPKQDQEDLKVDPSKMLEDEIMWLSSSHADPALLLGHLKLIKTLFTCEGVDKRALGKDYITTLLDDFLFAASKFVQRNQTVANEVLLESGTSCTSKECRTAAFDIFVTLAEDCSENLCDIVTQLISRHHSQLSTSKEWEFQPPVAARPSRGFVGLQNGGATCYMNSVIQQLYMQPGIREALLKVDESKTKEMEGVFYQMQTIFGHLMEGKMQYYRPETFWKCFKLWGQPVNVREQQDAFEFFTSITNQLDEQLKKSENEEIFKKTFCGMFADQKICKECPHRYEREEEFYSIPVTVKCRTLESSLEQFVNDEIMEGDNAYYCEKCRENRTTIKRVCIKSLPQVLVIQLKRFWYDWEAGRAIKFDDSFQFPWILDVQPYTTQGMSKEETKSSTGSEKDLTDKDSTSDQCFYELVGIIVHSGQANAGHYYSFIKNRRSTTGHVNRWYKFNDTTIEEFEMTDANLEAECFGGSYKVARHDKNSQYPEKRIRNWNAYMLFYEAIDKNIVSNLPRTGSRELLREEIQELRRSVPSSPTSSSSSGPPSPGRNDSLSQLSALVRRGEKRGIFNDPIPPSIRRLILEDNLQFMQNRDVYNQDYFRFVHNLCSCNLDRVKELNDDSGKNIALCSFQLAVQFLFNTYFRTTKKLRMDFQVWFRTLDNLLRISSESCLWFLNLLAGERAKEYLGPYLVECPDSEIRTGFCNILISLFECSLTSEDWDITSLVDKVICQLLDLVETNVINNSRQSNQYFEFFHKYSCISFLALKSLYPKGIFKKFVNFLVGPACHTRRNKRDAHMLYDCRDVGGFLEENIKPEVFLCIKTEGFVFSCTTTKPDQRFVRRWSSAQAQEFGHLHLTLIALIVHSDTKNKLPEGVSGGSMQTIVNPSTKEPLVEMCEEIEQTIYGEDGERYISECLYACIEVPSLTKSLAEMFVHICWCNEDISKSTIRQSQILLERMQPNDLRNVLQIISDILCMEDPLQSYRVNLVVDGSKDENIPGILSIIKNSYISDPRRSYQCIKLLVTLSHKCSLAKSYLLQNPSRWQWAVDWLKRKMNEYYWTAQPHVSNESHINKSFQRTVSAQYTLAEATALLTEIERQEKSQAVNQSTPKKNSASTSTEPNFADFPEEDWDKEVAGDA